MTKRTPTKKTKKTTPVSKPARTSVNWISKANVFLESHKRKVIGGLVALSLLLSIIYYLQARDSSIMTVYKWVNSDMNFFDLWAKDIVAGDWLGKDALLLSTTCLHQPNVSFESRI